MPNVPLHADVSPGDLIVTSGFGGRFPPGFPVGEVERVQRDSGATFATVYMRPFAALDRGREVLLIEPQLDVPALPVEQP
jgi:rod shape-determining protein MreC